MTPLSVVTWKWDTPGYRSTFGPEAVNVLARMARRHYAGELRVICVTNEPAGIGSDVEIAPDRCDFARVPSPMVGGRNPSCYRRLRAFGPDAAVDFGPRIVSLDLDCVILGDVTPLWDRAVDFVGWSDPFYPQQLNGSMFLLTAGARPHVWNDFDPKRSPAVAKASGFRGSDQAWLSYQLRGAPRWDSRDGVYSFIKDCERGGAPPPPGARVVFFHGRVDPWSAEANRLAWVREHHN